MRFYRTLPGGSTLDITSFFMNRSLVSRMLILGLPLLTVVLLLIFVATGSSIENIVNRAIARNAQLQAQGMRLALSTRWQKHATSCLFWPQVPWTLLT